MNIFILSDLHLTDKKEDWYKWEVFDWTKKILNSDSFDYLFILGDLFDKKDRHPAQIVNKLVKYLNEIVKECDIPIKILMGNHDYVKNEHPFLEFLGQYENIQWIGDNLVEMFPKKIKVLWLPHSRTPTTDWEDLDFDVDYVFMHQSIIGSVTSNFFEMNHGLDPNWLSSRTSATIYSGDIHVPQTVKNVTYIGTQYPVAFGDTYKPRALSLNLKTGKEKSFYMPTIQKLHIQTTSDFRPMMKIKLKERDQVKVTVTLDKSELPGWNDIKKEIITFLERKGVEIFDIKIKTNDHNQLTSDVIESCSLKSNTEIFNEYCSAKKVPISFKKIGQKIMES